MLIRVSLLLLIVSASSNPMSCFQTNDRSAALTIGNVQTGDPIAAVAKDVSPHLEAGDSNAREETRSAPLFQALIRSSTAESGGLVPLPGEISGDGVAFLNLVAVAYQTPFHRVINQAPEVEGKYAVSVVAPSGREDLLYPMFRQMVEATFRIQAHRETRDMNVFVLRLQPGRQVKLRSSQVGNPQHWFACGKMHADKQSMTVLTDVLENLLDRAVVDETGLEGEYDWEFSYKRADETSVITAVHEDLGLEMVPATRPIEVLVVDQPAPDAKP